MIYIWFAHIVTRPMKFTVFIKKSAEKKLSISSCYLNLKEKKIE